MWAKTIQWTGENALLIDQRKLPDREVYVKIETADEMFRAIRNMLIRGAPAIGVAAGYGVALAAIENCNKSYLKEKIELIESARPTARNLFYATSRMKKLLNRDNISKKMFIEEAIAIHEEDKKLTESLGEHGSKLIKNGYKCMTICNAGALATGGIGTALSVFYIARQNGKDFTVFAPETRPYLQGARLTAWELKKNEIKAVLITDGAIPWIIKSKGIDIILTGADRIARNGDTANKIGTYGLSLAADKHDVPLYVVAPSTTIDREIESGDEITIEERNPEEVTHCGNKKIAPEDISVMNPAFDITPNHLITGIITEKGIIYPPFDKNMEF